MSRAAIVGHAAVQLLSNISQVATHKLQPDKLIVLDICKLIWADWLLGTRAIRLLPSISDMETQKLQLDIACCKWVGGRGSELAARISQRGLPKKMRRARFFLCLP